jgi:hypothetical protein
MLTTLKFVPAPEARKPGLIQGLVDLGDVYNKQSTLN